MTATRFTLPSFSVESHKGTKANATINKGISKVRIINDLFRTLVMYSLWITNPNALIFRLICYGLNKNVIHGGQLLLVTHHLEVVKNQLGQFGVARLAHLPDANV